MWAIRFLNGPLAGHIINLKEGKNLIGRAPQCDVKVLSNGVSKEHAEIQINNGQVFIIDLKSSNGTFINGVKTQKSTIRIGDKVAVHDILFELAAASQKPKAPAHPVANPHVMMGNVAVANFPTQNIPMQPQGFPYANPNQYIEPQNQSMMSSSPTENHMVSQGFIGGIVANVKDYIDKVVMPGIYRLGQYAELKIILGGFLSIFIIVVTLLSIIPMSNITQSSILHESKRRASSLARLLAENNRLYVLQNNYTLLSTQQIEVEDGVKKALIIQQTDGLVLAPQSKAGTTPDIPFLTKIRKDNQQPMTEEIDSSTIAASFPIAVFNPETNDSNIKAHAVVFYDIGSLNFDEGKVLSLYFQTLVLALIVGLIIFYFMYKLIEFPIVTLNYQLDEALREKKDNLEIKFLFPALQSLVGNVNSLLVRYIHGEGDNKSSQGGLIKNVEAQNIVNAIVSPAITIDANGIILSANEHFRQYIVGAQLIGLEVSRMSDTQLGQNIIALIEKCKSEPGSLQSSILEFTQGNASINCQGIFKDDGNVSYFIVVINKIEGGV